MTENPIRVGRASDAERFMATDRTVWFAEAFAAPAEEQMVGLAEEHRFAADVDGSDPGTYAGVYGVYPLTLSIPGPGAGVRQVPCSGLTWVGVHPDHRRKGVLTAMLRHHFEQVHDESGTHVSALHASEPAIYGRYGYGLASQELEVSLGRGTTLTSPHLQEAAGEITTQLVTVSRAGRAQATARVPPGVGRSRLRWSGQIGYYDAVCRQFPEELRGKEPLRVLFARRDGEDVGFACSAVREVGACPALG
jgi:GNAT superfamily N-acetyltransferase